MKDRGFCSPIINEVEVTAQKKKAEMDHEIEKIKKEYEEKIKKRISKDKDDNKDKENGIDDKKEKEDRLKTDHNEHTAEKEKNDKVTITDEISAYAGAEYWWYVLRSQQLLRKQ